MISESQSLLTDKQKKYFDALYQTLDVSDSEAKIPLPKIVTLLESSGLDKVQLKKIWQLSFRENKLNKGELFTALEYVTLAQNDKELVPKNLILARTELSLPRFDIKGIDVDDYEKQKVAEKTELSPMESLKVLKENIDRYEEYAKRHMESDAVKKLNSANARKFYADFDLHHSILAEIWNLCDISGKGYLDEGEVILSLHFIEMYLKHIQPPFSLNPVFVQFAAEYLNLVENKKSAKRDYKGINNEHLNSVTSLKPSDTINGSKGSTKNLQLITTHTNNDDDLIYLNKLINIVETNTQKLVQINTSFNELLKAKQQKKQLLLINVKEMAFGTIDKLGKLKSIEDKLKTYCDKINTKIDHLNPPMTEIPAESVFNKLVKRVEVIINKDFEDVLEEIKLGDVPTVSEIKSHENFEKNLEDRIEPVKDIPPPSNDETENEIANLLESKHKDEEIDPFTEALENTDPAAVFDFGNNIDFDEFGDSDNKINKVFVETKEEVKFEMDFNF